jgi:hypothetical protein
MKVLKLGEEDTSGIASSALGMVTTEKGILTGQTSATDFLVHLVSPLHKESPTSETLLFARKAATLLGGMLPPLDRCTRFRRPRPCS